jgi:hypothetical protein
MQNFLMNMVFQNHLTTTNFCFKSALTYPEVGAFFSTHVGPLIPCKPAFAKLRCHTIYCKISRDVFLGQVPYITVDPQTKKSLFIPDIE